MLQEVIVVEGKMDIRAVKRAVDADCIITDGFRLKSQTIKNIRAAYQKRGIIILTDPDTAGENIRQKLAKIFPGAKHAFIPQGEALNTSDGDIGIEQASSEAIREALAKVRTQEIDPKDSFSMTDMVKNSLIGTPTARLNRAKLGRLLGLGHANGKTFLKRLNTYGVTREEFDQALESLE